MGAPTTTTTTSQEEKETDYQPPSLTLKDLELFSLLEHPIWVFNISKRSMTWANPAGVELWDAKSLQELQQRSFQEMSESTVTRLKDYQTNSFNRGEKVKDQWTYYPNGVAKTVQVTMSGIQLVGCEDLLMLNEGAYVLDNVSQKDALWGVEMLRHLPISVTQFDIEGNVMYQNPEALETFGNTMSHFLARFVDQQLGERVLREVQEGITVSVEANQYTTNDTLQWSALKLRQAKDPVTSQPVILYSARDITDIINAKREKEQAGKKSEFLAIMAHEIRTPLHQVTGFIDLLAQTELDLEQRSFIKLLQTSAHALMVVISDVLDYSKLEAGKMKLERIPFEPQVVLEASLDAVRQSYDGKGLSLCLTWDPTIPFRILGDSNRLRQVLLNLLSNAQKFTTNGGVQVSVQHQESDATTSQQQPPHEQQNGMLRFNVKDTGMGISEEHLPLIFQEYQQANASVARNFGGTGLGLSICKQLVQNMGGTIGVDSTVGEGSTFWFTLPYETPPEETVKQTTEKTTTNAATTAKGLQVLVAEDNLVNQKLVASMLKRTGHTAKVVENGKEAVQEIVRQQSHYDLILMDLQMPVMDGLEATRLLRSKGYTDIPIYALTASVQRQDFEELGFTDWIGKPIPMKKFKEKLQRLQQCHSIVQEDRGCNKTAAAATTTTPLVRQ